jgi:hypothetical protein
MFRNLIFGENTSIFPQQDEIILEMLWGAIKGNHYNFIELDDENHLKLLARDRGRIFTQGGAAYWQDLETTIIECISDDYEVINAVDAFNALRGKQDQINYVTPSLVTADIDGLGDLEDHPF